MEVSGPMEVTLYVSSDAKDTDFTAKVLDVYPDGTAFNLDETIRTPWLNPIAAVSPLRPRLRERGGSPSWPTCTKWQFDHVQPC